MTMLVYLIPVALFLGGISLLAFLWALRSGQYEDLDGAAERIFIEEEEASESRGATPDGRRRHTGNGDRRPLSN